MKWNMLSIILSVNFRYLLVGYTGSMKFDWNMIGELNVAIAYPQQKLRICIHTDFKNDGACPSTPSWCL